MAYDACTAPHLLPAFTPEIFRELAQWEVVSSYSSATAPDSHGISCADPLFQARKELESRTSDLRSASQDYLMTPNSCCHVERSRDISGFLISGIFRDSSTSLGMTKTNA